MTFANVLVPSIGRSAYTAQLLHTLAVDPTVRTIRVVDNRDGDGLVLRKQFKHPKVEWQKRPRAGIYQIWSDFIQECDTYQPVTDLAVILNDDVILQPGAVAEMVHAAHIHPGIAVFGFDVDRPTSCLLMRVRPVHGTYRAHGIPGFAFAVRPQLAPKPLVDPQFEWWGGDDDMVFTITRKFNFPCVVAEGIGVDHPQPSSSAIHYPELAEAIERDRQRLLCKWGETW